MSLRALLTRLWHDMADVWARARTDHQRALVVTAMTVIQDELVRTSPARLRVRATVWREMHGYLITGSEDDADDGEISIFALSREEAELIRRGLASGVGPHYGRQAP